MSESYEVPYKELGVMGRAIDAYVLASVRAERERIIAILESLKGTCSGDCDDCRPYAQIHDNYLTGVIALIKGDTE